MTRKKNAKRKRVRCIVKGKCAPVNTGYPLNGQRGLEAAGPEVYRIHAGSAALVMISRTERLIIIYKSVSEVSYNRLSNLLS